MGLNRISGHVFKEILFGNKRIKATTYDGLVIYIPFGVLGNMIYQTLFDVVEDKGNFVATDFTFQPKDK